MGAAAAGGVSGLLGAWPGGKGVRVPELAGGPANERVRWFEIVDAVEQQSAGRWLGGTGCVRFNKVGMHGPLYRCGKQRYCKSNKVTPTNEG